MSIPASPPTPSFKLPLLQGTMIGGAARVYVPDLGQGSWFGSKCCTKIRYIWQGFQQYSQFDSQTGKYTKILTQEEFLILT